MQQIGPLLFPDSDTHFQAWEDQYGGVVNYQKPQRDYALGFVKDFRLAIDVGGHVGIFSRHFAEHFEKVIAFEPMPEVRACLERNVPKNVSVRSEAISRICGAQTLTTPGLSNSGNSYLEGIDTDVVPNASTKDIRQTLVTMITIDSLALPHLGLIKIDVQGADFDVLQGAAQTLQRCKTVVLIEEKPIGGPEGSIKHIEQIQTFMRALGATAQEKKGADRVYTFE